jgi:hypothetical protein
VNRTFAILVHVGFLFSAHSLSAQLAFSGRYTYLNAKDWDDAIRVYNFARPWLNQTQPFLTSGWDISAGWYAPVQRKKSFFIKPEAGWSHWRSTSENPGNNLLILLNSYYAQVNFSFNPRALFQSVSAGPLGTRWFFQMSPGITFWSARVKKNEEDWLWDEESAEIYKPLGISAFLSGSVGYRAWMVGGQWVVTPHIGIRYFPAATLEDFPEAVQGSNLYGLKSRTLNFISLNAGMEFTWIIPKKGKKK